MQGQLIFRRYILYVFHDLNANEAFCGSACFIDKNIHFLFFPSVFLCFKTEDTTSMPSVPIRIIPAMTRSPPSHCWQWTLSPNTAVDSSMEVNGIIPEKAAAVNTLHRFIPEYQQIKARAVTNTPYHRRAIHSMRPIPESLCRGCSNGTEIRHRTRAIADTMALCVIGLEDSFSSALDLTAEIRDKVLKADSLTAAQSTSIFPPICSRDKSFPGVNTP